jgi:hypothetical protein
VFTKRRKLQADKNTKHVKLRNLENSNIVSMLDAPESDLIVPITRTNEVILVWVEIK